MYWVPISGSYVVASCSEDPNTTCESDLFIDGMCAIKIGQFEKGKNFVTEAKSTKNEDFQLNTPTSQEQACMANMVTSAVKWGAARLVTRGHVSNKVRILKCYDPHVPKKFCKYIWLMISSSTIAAPFARRARVKSRSLTPFITTTTPPRG